MTVVVTSRPQSGCWLSILSRAAVSTMTSPSPNLGDDNLQYDVSFKGNRCLENNKFFTNI